MATNIGAKVELAGEREFRQALTEINAGLRVTSSELKLVTAQYSENAGSVKALTERGNVLQNQISGQREKIEKLQAALQNAATQYGESDKRTMQWQTSLNKAQTELIGMEGELKNNSEALKTATDNMEQYGLKEDEVKEPTESLGGALSNMISKLGIDLPAGADKAIKALDGSKVSMTALIGATTGIITGFAKTTIEAAKTADEIMTMSSTTGLATDTLQELEYASEFVDVSVETMTGSMTKMIRSMDDARKGTGDAADAFHKLHLRVTDNNGQLKDSEQMFYDTIDALGQMKNETERDAASMAIFGKSARELNPVIEAGSKRLKELGIEAKDMGYVLDTDALESLGALDDAMHKFDKQSDSFKNSIAMVMLPPLTALFELLNQMDPKVLATVAIIASIAVVAVTVVKAVSDITSVFKGMNPAMWETVAVVVAVTAGLIALATLIGVIAGKGDEMSKVMADVGTGVTNMTNTVNGASSKVRAGHNALGTSSWRGGLTWVGEEGPELMDLPAGTRIYNNRQSIQIAREQPEQGGVTVVNFNVKMSEIDEVYKLIAVVKGAKQALRAGEVDLA